MNFVVRLSKFKRGYNALWVIVNYLAKLAYFIAVNDNTSINQPSQLYIKKIVKLHRVPRTIVSDQDIKFVSIVWKCLNRSFGSNLAFNTTYHPQTNGQTERVNQVIEDTLMICCLDKRVNWIEVLPFMGFAYDNNYQTTIMKTLYKALYGRKFRLPLHQDEIGERNA